MAKTDQELAQDILDGEGINWRYGGDTIAGALMPFRREVLAPEQSQFIGYDDRGQAIIQNIPAQYGETQFDLSYSPAMQSLQGVGSALRDVFFGDANTQAKAVNQAVSALRGVAGGIADYASGQYKAAMGGGTIYDPSTREVTEFDPALVLGGGSSGGGAALASGFRMSGKTPVASIIQQFRDAPESKLEYQKQALAGDENAIAALMEDKLIDRETALSQAQASVDRDSYRQDYRARQQSENNTQPAMQISQADDYRGAHEPPDREYGAPLNDLTSMIPSDVYGPAGPRLYGLGDSEVDSEAFGALRSARGNPDTEVVVYRAVPEGVSEINSGDWVTTSRKYADMHGENALGGKYKILEQKARAGDLFSEGYPYEFGWNPLSMNPEARMQRAQDLGFEADTAAKGARSALRVRPPSDNITNVRNANFQYPKTIGDETVNINSITGNLRVDQQEQTRINRLADQISSPEGYISRIIVDQNNNVIEGQHRLEALRQLGAKEVPVYKIEELADTMPVRKMEEAINTVGNIHSDHVNQIMQYALDNIAEEGVQGARNFDFGNFQKYYDAALNAVEDGESAFVGDVAAKGVKSALRSLDMNPNQ